MARVEGCGGTTDRGGACAEGGGACAEGGGACAEGGGACAEGGGACAEGGGLLMYFPPYGSLSDGEERCPTCRGRGSIPKGNKDQLLAVIPCNDVRLKPRRTKLYVGVSMVTCLLLCCIFLFFLFPRSVSITPVSVMSVLVFFTPSAVHMEVMNLINVTNQNFVPVQVVEFNIQALLADTIIGNNKRSNISAIQSRSRMSFVFKSQLTIVDSGINSYCQSASITSHTLFLMLQMTMNISYLSHTEQLSRNSYEYIDCGANSTLPHPIGGTQKAVGLIPLQQV